MRISDWSSDVCSSDLSEQEYMYALDYEIPLIREHRADLYVFPNEPHQKFQPRHKLAVYERKVDWFRFWLQGYEDPDPAKAAQRPEERRVGEACVRPGRARLSGST